MTARDVLVVAPIRPRQMARLAADFVLHRLDEASDQNALVTGIGDRIGAIVTTGSAGAPADLITRLPSLEVIATSSVGYDKIDLHACRARQIAVTNTPDVLTDDVADLALGLLLASQRRLVDGDAWVRSGDWVRSGAFPLTTSLTGRRVGILGLGAIGQGVARRCAAFGMDVGYCTRQPRDTPLAYFADPVALADWSDILIACVPGGDATHHLIGSAVLAALGPEGTLINVARGSVVDEDALIDALTGGRLAAAGLDVFASEPAPDPRLAALRNVTLSPHHASGTVRTRDAMAQLVVDNLLAWRDGRPLLTPVG